MNYKNLINKMIETAKAFPIKSGDVVYEIYSNSNQITAIEICEIEFKNSETIPFVLKDANGYCIEANRLGTYAFLSKEEAEKIVKSRVVSNCEKK